MKTRPCGNPECSTCTGIDDRLTFGSGELDDNGFWQFPCKICEDYWYEIGIWEARWRYALDMLALGVPAEGIRAALNHEDQNWLAI